METQAEKAFCIYMHTSPSGKSYIGQTNNLHRRGVVHRNTDGCRAFANAIKKYGWDNFTHKILISGLTLGEANAKETELIAEHGTLSPGGYNLRTGGGSQGFSEETRVRLSAAGKARRMSDGAKKKLSELGRNMSKERMNKLQEGKMRAMPETKIRISIANKGKKRTDEEKLKISEATKAALANPETRAKMALVRTGTKRSDETKARQSDAARLRWLTARENGTNKFSDSAKANMSVAHKNRWEKIREEKKAAQGSLFV